jgi:2,3-bisphosphoglycerate-independent phosphoglycerate mutase
LGTIKYIVIIGDGMTDRPLKELGGKTPLQQAFTPHMDRLAREGIIGSVRTVPPGYHPGSDVANLSILGYDPRVYYTGRAPLEAASMGVALGDNDVAYRCNLVTLRYDKENTNAVMEDYSAGHISSHEAAILIKEVNDTLGNERIRFYPGVSYRHLMIWMGGEADADCIPPHDIIGKDIVGYLPRGRGEEVLRKLMRDSEGILRSHVLNRGRIERGKRPANAIWLWGQGRRPLLPKFRDKYSIEGALVSAVDLTKGLGAYAGFEILKVPGVTGYIDTNYTGKAEYSLDALERVDLVYIHVEAPDEAGHSGNYHDKIRAIEDIDALVVGTILRGAKSFGEYRILLMPDHATPVEVRTHTDEPVPFVIFDSRLIRGKRDAAFDESLLKRDDLLVVDEGYTLMDYFIKGL